jgi:hypothetical protein
MFPDGGISAVCKRAWASITKTCYIEFIPTKILCLHPSSTPPHATIKQRLSTVSSEGLSTEKRRKKTDESFFAWFTARQKAETKLQSHPLFLWNTWTSKMHKKAKKRRMVLVLGFVAAVAMVNDLPDDIVRLHPCLDPLASSLLRLSVPVNLRQ